MPHAKRAAGLILSHCQHIGSFHGDTSPYEFLRETASLMHTAEHTDLFPERYKEHVAYALEIVGTNDWRTPPSAIASVYLATRFEFYFRMLSAKLKSDGSWISVVLQHEAQKAISDRRLKKTRISSVSLVYKLMKLEQTSLARHCKHMDAILYSSSNSAEIKDIGDRIEWTRHRAGHGEWGDISAEAVFYGLMTALIFFCNQ